MQLGELSRLGIILTACGLAACGPGTVREVSKSEFERAGLIWPLTVDQGSIGCDVPERAWFGTGDGTRYGLNGRAIGSGNYADIEPLWAEDKKLMGELKAEGASENAPPIRLSIGDMIAEALKLCR